MIPADIDGGEFADHLSLKEHLHPPLEVAQWHCRPIVSLTASQLFNRTLQLIIIDS
jgi:hypothetical protein